MTKEDALDDIFWHRGISTVEHTAINTVDTVWLLRSDVQKYVTKIYNDYEAELEGLQQPKSCEGCYFENSFSNTCLTCKRNYADNFKKNK